MNGKYVLLLIALIAFFACGNPVKERIFSEDVELLKNVEGFEVLQDGNAMLAVSGVCQGRIFTSSSKGMKGKSYGYFNRKLVESGDYIERFSGLGGEGRMIFGPEVGKYAIFFAPGTPQNANTIEVSPQLNNKRFDLISKDKRSITYGATMEILNANNYIFTIDVERTVTLKTTTEIEKELNVSLTENVSTVGFSAESSIVNAGNEQWKKENGLLSIWDIGCMLPSEKCVVIIPYRNKMDSVTNYFTPNNGRVKLKNSCVIYKADAAYMNKLGIRSENCKDVFGSYSPELNLLSITKYNFEDDLIYVNSVWGHEDPYQGDVINIFNGEVNEKLDRNWPFFEFESSSSAKELKVGDKQSHKQTIYHFEGDELELDKIAIKVLGISLKEARFSDI